MEVIIRRRRIEDLAGIARVTTTAWQETYRGIVDNEFLDNSHIFYLNK